MALAKLYVGNDNLVEIVGLIDATDDSAVTSGTVTATVKDSAGATIAGPITMTHAGAGLWRGVIPDTAGLTAGETYSVTISADAGTDKKAVWTLTVTAELRTS